ncbi:hypothetical protein [Sporosarcina sp. SAFN-015]|uniref:hypothetical protein n=1 Tax=Sporosarcina sp. SAFN-015 TaxID=3387274 RepID=UPI003F80D218
METLIIAIAMGLISMFFKGKKSDEPEKKSQPKRPPASQGPSEQPDPIRKLKEMSREMYKEIQREFQTEIDEPPSRQPSERQPAPAVTTPFKAKVAESRGRLIEAPVHVDMIHDRTSKREPHRGRLSAHQGTLITKEPVKHNEMIPKNENDLIKGIIFSEILGPPKSKQ